MADEQTPENQTVEAVVAAVAAVADVAAPSEGTTIEVEPAPEGPKVKPKRVLTQKQLEALQKGRERLAEIRKAAKEAEEAEAKVEASPYENELESTQQDSWCSIM
jgi:aspartate oxidase